MCAFAAHVQACSVIYRIFSTHGNARSLVVAPCSKLQEAPILRELVVILFAHGFPAKDSRESVRSWIHGMQGHLEKQKLEDLGL
jgi:hypothetical protein